MTRHLTAGDTAPDFTLSDTEGRSVSLADYSGKNVIVYFYPKAATPGSHPWLHDRSLRLPRQPGLAAAGRLPGAGHLPR